MPDDHDETIKTLRYLLQNFATEHVRAGITPKEQEDPACADWCYLCRLQKLERTNENLRRRRGRLFRCLRTTQDRLRRAQKEIAGRKGYEEDLKAALVNQHIELCQLKEKYLQLKQASDEAYVLVEKSTPYGRYVPLRNVISWLIESRRTFQLWYERDQRELRLLKDDRFRAIGLLMDHGIYSDGLEGGVKELLTRIKSAERRWPWQTLLRRGS